MFVVNIVAVMSCFAGVPLIHFIFSYLCLLAVNSDVEIDEKIYVSWGMYYWKAHF